MNYLGYCEFALKTPSSSVSQGLRIWDLLSGKPLHYIGQTIVFEIRGRESEFCLKAGIAVITSMSRTTHLLKCQSRLLGVGSSDVGTVVTSVLHSTHGTFELAVSTLRRYRFP
jgi:hypothetical protein